MSNVHYPIRSILMVSVMTASAGFCLTALAQAPVPSPQNMAGHSGPMSMHPQHMQGMQGDRTMMNDPKAREARRAERHQRHLNEMKIFLQLQPSQESAWAAFESVMKQPIKRHMAAVQADVEKMSTPERIDKLMAIKAEHDAEIAKRMNASKTFYNALTPAQQKVFDTHAQKFSNRSPMGQHGKMHP